MIRPKAPKDVLQNCGVTTQRQWRRLKREQLRLALRAMHQVRCGCVYTPVAPGVYVGAIIRQIEQLQRAWSVQEWGK